MSLLADIVAQLAPLQNPDGGWGAAAAHPSNPEATALAARALAAAAAAHGDAARDDGAAALAWLRAARAPDGTYPFLADAPAAVWPTAVVAWSLAGVPAARAEAVRAGRALLGVEGRGNVWWVRLLGRLYPEQKEAAFETDLDLTGWPWVRDTASWVEPTAWAVLALRALREDLPRHAVDHRLGLADAMFRDRACPGGGWNYGNGRALGQDLRPYPDTTALALLALRPAHPSPETEAGLAALDRMLETNHSSLAAALASLCRAAYGLDAAPLAARLDAAFARNRFRGDVRTLALAAIALAGAPAAARSAA